jgi:glycosyltransferase involved in cell wall biosynthesis
MISIITPSLNQAKYLEQAILSVRAQGSAAYEHIVIDGGSDDNTVRLLQGLEADSRLRWISEPDRGQAHAFNKGLAMAHGDIVGWINADDTLLPGAFDAALGVFSTGRESMWVHGDGFWLSSEGGILGRRKAKPCGVRELLIEGMIVTQPSLFVRRAALLELQGLDENIDTCMDYDICLHLARRWPGAYIPRAIATRRMHEDTKTESLAAGFYGDTLYTLDKFFQTNGLSAEIRALERLAYARPHMVEGYRRFLLGDFNEARTLLRQFIQLRAPYLADRHVLASLLLIVESLIGVSWIKPGNTRRRAEAAFRSQHGAVAIDFRDPDLDRKLTDLL